jgi:GMP synthase PP-ATPase subunit
VNRFAVRLILAMKAIALRLQVSASGYSLSSYYVDSIAISIDATSPTVKFDGSDYKEISGVSRVNYDIPIKPPATIELG